MASSLPILKWKEELALGLRSLSALALKKETAKYLVEVEGVVRKVLRGDPEECESTIVWIHPNGSQTPYDPTARVVTNVFENRNEVRCDGIPGPEIDSLREGQAVKLRGKVYTLNFNESNPVGGLVLNGGVVEAGDRPTFTAQPGVESFDVEAYMVSVEASLDDVNSALKKHLQANIRQDVYGKKLTIEGDCTFVAFQFKGQNWTILLGTATLPEHDRLASSLSNWLNTESVYYMTTKELMSVCYRNYENGVLVEAVDFCEEFERKKIKLKQRSVKLNNIKECQEFIAKKFEEHGVFVPTIANNSLNKGRSSKLIWPAYDANNLTRVDCIEMKEISSELSDARKDLARRREEALSKLWKGVIPEEKRSKSKKK